MKLISRENGIAPFSKNAIRNSIKKYAVLKKNNLPIIETSFI